MRPVAALLGFAALTSPLPATAQPGGPLTTLPIGRYECSLPGSADGAPWRVVEDKRFSIKNASRYVSDKGDGVYLMAGRELVFTRGPLKDMHFRRMGSSILREVKGDGTLGRLRCVRIGPLR